jgi:hypothetical protein
MKSSQEHVTAMVEARQRVGYTEERPRQVAYKALGCSGCNRPFGAGHDDFCRVLDPGPEPVRPAGPIATLPTEQLCVGPCGQVLPATVEHFQRGVRGKLWPICKRCHVERVTAGLQAASSRPKGRYGDGAA